MEGFPLKRLGEVREAFERTHFNRRWKALGIERKVEAEKGCQRMSIGSLCVLYKTLLVLVGPIWSSPSLFGLYQDKSPLPKITKNGAQYATKSKTYKVHAHHDIV